MNITDEVQMPPVNNPYTASAPKGFLVDEGGWTRMDITNPFLDPWFYDMQTSLPIRGDPSLQARAYRAAWWVDDLNMYNLNISEPGTNRTAYLDSFVGERFPVNTSYFDISSKDKLLSINFWNS